MSFTSFYQKLKSLDWLIIIPSLLLAGLSLTTILSSSYYLGIFFNFQKQTVFLLAGIALMIVFSFLDWRVLRDGPYLLVILYSLCLVGLVGLLFFAPHIRGSRSWYRFGPVSFDPIEFTKVVLIILLAKYFSTRHVEVYRIRHILVSGLYVLAPAILILLQPEVGSVIILVFLWIGTLLVSGIKLRHFLILCLCGLILLALSWSFLLKGYQKDRISSFLSPSFAPLGSGWNQAQAKVAIGSGGLFGKGFGNGTQIRYGFLPASQTDFAFAGVVEEWGLAGAGLVLLAFIVLIWRMIRLSLVSQSNFPRLFSAGLAIIMIIQIIINVGMNLGLLPIIGIPLPLISYGGSSLIATFIGLGIIQSMAMRP
ncbi:MAG: FtsW/RodA/SpoVE family cell cycle protein [bacterium]|nr:FtsW/RodA/SpoVE family cell cycle protein [bacterium]